MKKNVKGVESGKPATEKGIIPVEVISIKYFSFYKKMQHSF
jgi:hypothetical protein